MDLHVEVSGSGQPVVLLHSGGTDSRNWSLIAPLLANQNQVIMWDGRGVGKSPSPSGQVNYVEDLLSLLNHLDFEKATLIGHSIGGQIATDLTLTYPERVSKLVLIAPSLTGFDYSDEFQHYIGKINNAAPDLDKMVEASLSAPLYRVVMSSPQQELMVGMHRDYMKLILEWPPFQMVWPDPPAADRLHELKAETLFIIGEKDLPDNHRVADHFRQSAKIDFLEIPDGDHMVTLTHPEELVRHITEFMEE